MINVLFDRSNVFDEFQFIVGNMQSMNYDIEDIVKLLATSILNHKAINDAVKADIEWYVNNTEYDYLEYEAADKEWLRSAMYAICHTVEVGVRGALGNAFHDMLQYEVSVEEKRNHDILLTLATKNEDAGRVKFNDNYTNR